MHAWQNKKIFGLAKELHWNIDILRTIAGSINEGKESVSALNVNQAGEMINYLRREVEKKKSGGKPGHPPAPLNRSFPPRGGTKGGVEGHPPKRPDDREWDYMKNNDGKWSQMDMLFDYMVKLDWKIWDLRAWIRRYFKVDHEGWLYPYNIGKAIEGLKAMYKRKQTDA